MTLVLLHVLYHLQNEIQVIKKSLPVDTTGDKTALNLPRIQL